VGEGNKDNYLIKEINLSRNVGDGGHLYGEEFLGIYF
jgi:hypothetical protein